MEIKKKFILYVGLNDKDTNRQELPFEKALKLVTDEAVKALGFATISPCNGCYTFNDGRLCIESTIRIEHLTEATESKNIIAFANRLKMLLNQESICLETADVVMDFI